MHKEFRVGSSSFGIIIKTILSLLDTPEDNSFDKNSAKKRRT